MPDLVLPAEHRLALLELKEALARLLGARLRSVILFGSAARGRLGEDSDLDVLVLVDPAAPEDGRLVVEAAVDVMLRRPAVVLSPLVMTTAQLDELRARERRFALDVDREGIIL